MPIQTAADSISNSQGSPFGFKNRIINGAMVIDQRNAGASVTINSSAYTYPVDRFAGFGEPTDGVYTLQQSSTAPAGFTNSLLATVTTADSSVGSAQRYFVRQSIEGLNIADLDWGLSTAKTITVSFWARSSLTGTFGGSIMNDNFDRAYPFTYTINQANTWEYETITIPGDTTGTWLKTNGTGLVLIFSIGAGSGRVGTAGAWQTPAAALFGATGQTNIIATNGATWAITGVQLEKGSQSTAFDYRDYGNELRLCQRYCYTIRGVYYTRRLTIGSATNNMIWNPQHPVPMRTTPTLLTSNFTSSTIEGFNYSANAPTGALTVIGMSEGDNYVAQVDMTFASGISSGQIVCWRWIGSPTAYVGFQAEL